MTLTPMGMIQPGFRNFASCLHVLPNCHEKSSVGCLTGEIHVNQCGLRWPLLAFSAQNLDYVFLQVLFDWFVMIGKTVDSVLVNVGHLQNGFVGATAALSECGQNQDSPSRIEMCLHWFQILHHPWLWHPWEWFNLISEILHPGFMSCQIVMKQAPWAASQMKSMWNQCALRRPLLAFSTQNFDYVFLQVPFDWFMMIGKTLDSVLVNVGHLQYVFEATTAALSVCDQNQDTPSGFEMCLHWFQILHPAWLWHPWEWFNLVSEILHPVFMSCRIVVKQAPWAASQVKSM